jgi:hypothetical protein
MLNSCTVANLRKGVVFTLGSGFGAADILCCDRLIVDLTYHSGRMQLCWDHLKRNILDIADYARSPRGSWHSRLRWASAC